MENKVCINLIESIHGRKYFERKLFCNGLIPLTPEKPTETSNEPASNHKELPTIREPLPPSSPEVFNTSLPSSSEFCSKEDLVRRHSISLIDRTPPPNSLSADILGFNPPMLSAKAKELFSSISEIHDSLSDFNSCLDSSGASSSSEQAEDLKDDYIPIKSMNDKKREKKKKRKLKLTPSKEQLLKKPNRQTTPTK